MKIFKLILFKTQVNIIFAGFYLGAGINKNISYSYTSFASFRQGLDHLTLFEGSLVQNHLQTCHKVWGEN